ncbi:MAG: N-acetyltransferase [Myxococcales bacterium]|nr:N-acetyltransferase [Myxococcales bacterium]
MSSQGYWAHPSAIVDEGAQLGAGTKVWHFSHICKDSDIGENCSFGQNVYVGPHTKVGAGGRIQNNVSIYDEVYLDEDVFVGPSAVFTNVINPRAHVPRKHEYKKTFVRRGATIGANATIVCGTTLGAYSFVAAGAVVTKDVRPFEMVGGVPARHMGWMCQCGLKLELSGDAGTCSCGSTYRLGAEGLEQA